MCYAVYGRRSSPAVLRSSPPRATYLTRKELCELAKATSHGVNLATHVIAVVRVVEENPVARSIRKEIPEVAKVSEEHLLHVPPIDEHDITCDGVTRPFHGFHIGGYRCR